VAKPGVVVEEADDAVYWLEVVEAARLGDRSTRVQLLTEAKELRAIGAAALRTARQNRRAASVRNRPSDRDWLDRRSSDQSIVR
jgi:hypothetical protein